MALTFASRVEFDQIDTTSHAAGQSKGSDAKGRGGANATAAFRIEPAGSGSTVRIHTELMMSGAVAQYGRGVGMIEATAAQIVGQFATNLCAQLAETPPMLEGALRPASSEISRPPPSRFPGCRSWPASFGRGLWPRSAEAKRSYHSPAQANRVNELIGARVPRLEDQALLTGKGRFVDDIAAIGALVAAFVRSPHPHALIRGVDAALARAQPGVVAVLTLDDLAPVSSSGA